MRARFVADSKVMAGPAPLGSVWRDAAAAGAELCEQMSQFVPQSAFNFRHIMFAQARI
jgi:hypothetical protein